MKHPVKKKRPFLSIHGILLTLSMVVLILPVGGIYFLKIYENELIRQTQAELIAQAAFIGAMYAHELSEEMGGESLANANIGRPVENRAFLDQYYHVVPLNLDLAHVQIQPRRPDGKPAAQAPHPFALDAGRKASVIMRHAQRTTLAGMKVLDSNGVAVAGRQELGQSFAHVLEVERALSGQPVSIIRERVLVDKPPSLASISRGARMNIFVAMPIFLKDRVVGVAWVNRTPKDILKALYDSRDTVILAGLLVLLLTLAIAGFTSYTITRPIHALIGKNRRFAGGDKTAADPLEDPKTRELAELSESFSIMARSIEKRSEYIRSFATHVSHEFKTPLTAIQGSVELLLEHLDTMTDEEKQRFLGNIQDDTTRLKRLVDRLLELARADMAESLDVSADLMAALQTISGAYTEKGLSVKIDNRTGQEMFQIPMSDEAARTILKNLLDNSVAHGATEAAITINQEEQALRLVYRDNGPGISAANREKLFTPFFTTRRDSGGTGLGLCIVKSLLENHHGDIRLLPGKTGACFELTLPAKDSD